MIQDSTRGLNPKPPRRPCQVTDLSLVTPCSGSAQLWIGAFLPVLSAVWMPLDRPAPAQRSPSLYYSTQSKVRVTAFFQSLGSFGRAVLGYSDLTSFASTRRTFRSGNLGPRVRGGLEEKI